MLGLQEACEAFTVGGAELGRHEAVLAARPYLAGATLTAADLTLYPALMLIGRIGTREGARVLGLRLDSLRAAHPAPGRVEPLQRDHAWAGCAR